MSNTLSTERLLGYLRLARAPKLGPILLKRALRGLGSLDNVLGATASRLATLEGIGLPSAEIFVQALAENEPAARQELESAWQSGIRVLCPESPEWPAGLKTIDDPPLILFMRGRLEPADVISIGVVGSRKCTLYGREQAERFGALLAGAGITVISGGARGIDTGAHHGALRAKGRTLVIQGCGLRFCYPEENADLYARIEQEDRGAILSELPLDTAPIPHNFPPRNRIIAGMSLGTLVVEANLKSGSLITARLAGSDYGREVFAIPGRVDSAASAGVHHLIKKGEAHLVENLEDVLNALGDTGTALARAQQKMTTPKPDPHEGDLFAANKDSATASASSTSSSSDSTPSAAPTPPAQKATPFPTPAPDPTTPSPRFTHVQQKILTALQNDPGSGLSVDDLCTATQLPASVVMAELTMLQIRSAVQRLSQNRFAQRKPH